MDMIILILLEKHPFGKKTSDKLIQVGGSAALDVVKSLAISVVKDRLGI